MNRRLPGFRCDGRDARESPHPHKGRGIEGWPPSNGGEKGPLQEMICAFFYNQCFSTPYISKALIPLNNRSYFKIPHRGRPNDDAILTAA